MSLLYKPDWEEAQQRYRAWWNHDALDRCALWVTAPKAGVPAEEYPRMPADPVVRWTDLDYLAARMDYEFRHTFFGGEAFPIWHGGYAGHIAIPAFLGCPTTLDFHTGWWEPLLTEEVLKVGSLRVNRTGRWWKFTRALLQRAVAESKGRCLVGVSDCGYAFRLLPKVYDDFIVEVTVKAAGAREFGQCFRSDPTADTHTAAVCNPGYSEISLIKYTANAPGPFMERWRGYTRINGDHFLFPPRKSVRLRVLASGPYIEVSVNGRLVIADVTMSRRSGHIGVFVADGAATFSDLTILPIRPPHSDLGR
jgi:hypothetical protein